MLFSPETDRVSIQLHSSRSEVVDLGGDVDTVDDTEWMADGKCRILDPSIFFPSDGVGVEVARRICSDCVVKGPCLEYALLNRIDHGVWGGTSERERRRIARRRRLSATVDFADTLELR